MDAELKICLEFEYNIIGWTADGKAKFSELYEHDRYIREKDTFIKGFEAARAVARARESIRREEVANGRG